MIIRLIIFIVFFGILFFVLPNVVNSDEKAHFSNQNRLTKAKEEYSSSYSLGDSVTIRASSYYNDKSSLHQWLFGKKYREIWDTEVKVPVLTADDSSRNFKCYDISGGMQTIGIEVKDEAGRIWTLRSIDKDQSAALSPFLRHSLLRPIIRDEVTAMNPYGAFVVDDLADAVDILHTNPRLVFIPYQKGWNPRCRDRMAGRLALLEEELDKGGWTNSKDYLNAEAIVDSDKMFLQVRNDKNRSIDTLAYLKARLFDILISDWDRHEGNWVWALKENKYIPIPIDRDMVFYKFNDGVLNKLVLLFNNKFRSFDEEFNDISGFSYNSKAIDQQLLKSLPEHTFVGYADSIQSSLTETEIRRAFHEYPESVYDEIGEKHIRILTARLDKLKMAAKEFFAAIHEDD